MTLDWTTLVLLCLAGAIAWFWQDSLAAREAANAAATEACERLALQFLDGTVAFARLGFGRGRGGHLVLRRTYVFDYTANSIQRRQGFVVIAGRQVETIGYAQDDERREAAVIRTVKSEATEAEPAQVIRLDDFRGRAATAPKDDEPTTRTPPVD